MPSAAAAAAAAKVVADATKASQDFTQLSQVTTLDQYQGTDVSSGAGHGTPAVLSRTSPPSAPRSALLPVDGRAERDRDRAEDHRGDRLVVRAARARAGSRGSVNRGGNGERPKNSCDGLSGRAAPPPSCGQHRRAAAARRHAVTVPITASRPGHRARPPADIRRGRSCPSAARVEGEVRRDASANAGPGGARRRRSRRRTVHGW